MKKILLISWVLMIVTTVFSEPIMRVEFTDGTFKDFEGESVKDLTFDVSDCYGTIQGKSYVDLGLSVKWATCDVGSESELVHGVKFAWGMTEPTLTEDFFVDFSEYPFSSTSGDDITFNKYCVDTNFGEPDGLTVLLPEDDAATVNWGSEWRMPTAEEVEELIAKCSLNEEYDILTGKDGVVFSSNISGFENPSLFFPYDYSGEPNYFTSSLSENNSILSYVYSVNKDASQMAPTLKNRNLLSYVRAVSSSDKFKPDSVVVIKLISGDVFTYFTDDVENVFFFDNDSVSSGALSGRIDEFEYVDLGLSVLWATKNVGAASSTDYGGLYAWGETEEEVKDPSVMYPTAYSPYQYKFCVEDRLDSLSKYCNNPVNGEVDGLVTLEQVDDAAAVNWSQKWRIPTSDEMKELVENCEFLWTSDYLGSGCGGVLVRSNVPGYTDNCIFLPAGGMNQYEIWDGKNRTGCYWSSSLLKKDCRQAQMLNFSITKTTPTYEANTLRTVGLSVRPVADK